MQNKEQEAETTCLHARERPKVEARKCAEGACAPDNGGRLFLCVNLNPVRLFLRTPAASADILGDLCKGGVREPKNVYNAPPLRHALRTVRGKY